MRRPASKVLGSVIAWADRTSGGLGLNNISLFVVASGCFKPVKMSIRDTTMIRTALLNLTILPVVYMMGFISEGFS